MYINVYQTGTTLARPWHWIVINLRFPLEFYSIKVHLLQKNMTLECKTSKQMCIMTPKFTILLFKGTIKCLKKILMREWPSGKKSVTVTVAN